MPPWSFPATRSFAIHGKENIDGSEEGRMVGIKLPTNLPAPGEPQLILKDKDPKIADGKAWEKWRLQHSMFTSSPALANGRVYQVSKTGVLVCVDVKTGKELFAKKKINNDQIHSSPLYADGHLYLAFPNGKFMVVKPGDDDAEIVSEVQLEGGILGSPVAWNGKIYLHTKTKLYCFGKATGQKPKATLPAAPIQIAAGKAVALQIIPGDVLLKPGQTIKLTVNTIDANGNVLERGVSAEFAKFIPPTAKVKTSMNAGVRNNAITADLDNVGSAGAFKATAGGLSGLLRGRILPKIPYTQDFESFKLTVDHKNRWRKICLPAAGLDGRAAQMGSARNERRQSVRQNARPRFVPARHYDFLVIPNSSNYTIEADVMTDGSRRVKGNIGVMNQRYFITLVGNQQILEVSSNHERVKASVPFRWSSKKWYRLKSRVDIAANGDGIIRAKAWAKGEPEPTAWTIEVKHKNAHKKGAPGIIGFSPQSLFRVYMDNISITNN